MTVTARALFSAKQAESTETTQYTAPANTRTIIDKFTATNTSGAAATLTVRIVPSGGSASASNTIISARSVAPGTTELCADMVTHILNPGDFISTLASAASSITIRASGREVN